LFRDGATFRAETSDFLHAASDDFHPTDVLEDVDGSILIVDTGGWFRIGCPTSQVAKPNVLGAIYRVRRTDAQVADPRGLRLLNANEYDPFRVIPWLGDARPAVRQRAMDELVRHAAVALPVLSRAIVHKQPLVRQNAIWTLARIGTPDAAGAIRLLGLTDSDPGVVSAAAYCAGALRDTAAASNLCNLLAAAETPPQVLRSVATALGQIGEKSAVPALLLLVSRGGDRVLEHALIYALIEIHDRDATAQGLASGDPRIRRAALIALHSIKCRMAGSRATKQPRCSTRQTDRCWRQHST
jgi:HEAT repeat protein